MKISPKLVPAAAVTSTSLTSSLRVPAVNKAGRHGANNVADGQDQLQSLWGPMQNENARAPYSKIIKNCNVAKEEHFTKCSILSVGLVKLHRVYTHEVSPVSSGTGGADSPVRKCAPDFCKSQDLSLWTLISGM